MTTRRELKLELAKLDQLLYATRLQEREAARRRIAELVVEFQLSPATVLRDVESALLGVEPPSLVLCAPSVELRLRRPGTPLHVAVKYRDPVTVDDRKGSGPRPRWLREALDAGRQLEEFLVPELSAAAVPGDPLREFEQASRRASARAA